MDISSVFKVNKISFQEVDNAGSAIDFAVPLQVERYLECMGKTIALNRTEHGSAYTTLFSVYDISAEQYEMCLERGLLIIGFGLNGDLLTVNLKNSRVGYVFHDDISEENYETIDDIYIELPMDLKQFIKMAVSGGDYPFDGHMAKEYNGIY